MHLENHPRRKLTDDVSMDELLQMRQDGMSNQEIANRLGVSKATVYRHLGARPKGIRYSRMKVDTPAMSSKQDKQDVEKPAQASRLAPCRQVWDGKACRMEVDYIDGYISISPDTGDSWELDAIPDIISDLVSLMRCVKEASVC